jgi:hypothetical protein
MYNPESSEQPLAAASNTKNRSSNLESPSQDKLLPLNYQPSKYSVVLGRSRAYQAAEGNDHMREIAKTTLHKYSKATSKLAKSQIVTKVVSMIHMKCPDGGAFVRLVNGRWNEVCEHVAREKVGYLFRELLHEKYRSSTKSKMARRRCEQHQSTPERGQQQQPCSPTFSTSARKSVDDMPMKGDSYIFPSMINSIDSIQPFGETREVLSSIQKVLQDGFKVIADAEKALDYYYCGQKEFCPNDVVLNPWEGEQAMKERDFLQEVHMILLSDEDIGAEDLSDLDISNIFDF